MPYHRGMEKLRALCDAGTPTISDLARRLNVAAPTVAEWCSGRRPVPIARCLAIERATEGAVTRRDLRPDDWQDIWPELADSEPNQPVALTNQAPAAINTEAKEATIV